MESPFDSKDSERGDFLALGVAILHITEGTAFIATSCRCLTTRGTWIGAP
jgi:hypothetical protein